MNTQIIAIANQKGGVGKTTTCANLGIGLAQAGKKVLLIDGDPQGSLTISLGHPQPDKLPFTLSDAMGRILMDEPLRPGEGILHHPEGVDLMPADIQLSGMEVSLVNAMSRETILRQYLDTLKGQYSHILIDCQPSLGMLTVNALAAANRVIIPVQAEYLPAKGLEQLLQTVNKVKRQINPKLQIDGILLTMVDNRTNFAKEIAALLRETYGSKIKVFGTEIPHSVRAKEISAEGKSIFAHDPNGKVAEGYLHSAAYASQHGEMAQYNRSYQANFDCKEAIEHAISAHYADNRLDTESAVKAVLEKFGSERVQFILANTIQHKDSDGRVSRDNKAWAKTIPMPEDSGTSRHCAYLVVDEVNLGLTDLFTRQARKTLQEPEKGSVLQKLKQEPTTHKPALSKKQEPER